MALRFPSQPLVPAASHPIGLSHVCPAPLLLDGASLHQTCWQGKGYLGGPSVGAGAQAVRAAVCWIWVSLAFNNASEALKACSP